MKEKRLSAIFVEAMGIKGLYGTSPLSSQYTGLRMHALSL